jgi:alpha-N-arabinofuranosidase
MIPLNKFTLTFIIVSLVILILATAYYFLAFKKTPPSAEPMNSDQVMPSTAIHIDSSKQLGAIHPELYGANHRFNRHGYGQWNPAEGKAYDKFNAAYDEAGFKSLRYPGGTVGNLFQWKQSIGPLKERKQVYDEISDAPDPADFGLDEAARYAETHGTTMIYMYGAGNGNAQDAADLVEYLNAPHDGSNPNGGTDWAAVRAANGHTEPYNIQYFEIGNEMYNEDQRYWLDGASDQSYQHNYVFGGTVTYTRQPVATINDYSEAASMSPGTPNLVKYAKFAPVNPGTDEVYVDETQWTRVDDLSRYGSEDVYTLDSETGKISFGDGVHGNIPGKNGKIYLSYSSTHDGFNRYYEAMKAVDPSIRIYSCLNESEFFNFMGDKYPYDGVVVHSYVSLPFIMDKYVKKAANSSNSQMDELQDRMMYMPVEKKTLAEKPLKEMRSKVDPSRADQVDVIITEYGLLNKGEPPDKNYRDSLGLTLYTAKMLMTWIDLEIPMANKQTLIGGGGAMIGDGPGFVQTPTVLMFKMFTRMFGDTRIAATVSNNPVMSINGKNKTGTLQIVSSKDAADNVYLIVVNGSRKDDVATAIDLAGSEKYKNVLAWNLNGASYTSYNTASNPDNVKITEDSLPYKPGSFRYTFPAHSITALKLVKSQ